jgi:uncharacterized protein (TIGR02217 family)
MYYDVELDICPGYGWQGGPTSLSEINKLRGGQEDRNWSVDVFTHEFNLPFLNIKDEDYLRKLKRAYMAFRGCTDSFKVKDWLDFEADFAQLEDSPGSTASDVQLSIPYDFGPASYRRDITKPDVATVHVYQADGSGNPVEMPGEVDGTTGIFTPDSAWTTGRQRWWSGEFFVPVRFNSEKLPVTIDSRSGDDLLINGSVELIEVFNE